MALNVEIFYIFLDGNSGQKKTQSEKNRKHFIH